MLLMPSNLLSASMTGAKRCQAINRSKLLSSLTRINGARSSANTAIEDILCIESQITGSQYDFMGKVMKNFGMTLKTLMAERDLSAQDLALAIAVPMRSVLEWTHNNRFPRNPAVIKKLSEYFHCSTHFIMYGEEDPRSNVIETINSAVLHTGLYEITVRKRK